MITAAFFLVIACLVALLWEDGSTALFCGGLAAILLSARFLP